MPQLHPTVDRILHSGQYVCRPHVESFTEHELKNAKGEVVRKVGKEELEKIAKVNNQKAANGALSPLLLGHTFDDQYDAKGKLVQKFPEEKQPKPLGYLYNFRVELNPHTGKHSLYNDEWIEKTIKDPETGQMVDGLKYSASFPRRSAEVYHDESWVDAVAALRRAPRLDLALNTYAKVEPEHALYSRAPNGELAPVCQMARNKSRYSFDTGGSDMGDEPKPEAAAADPTAPPTAEPAAPAPAPAAAAGPMELPPEHKEAAEQYAHHVFGMHHSRAKHLMTKYAADCGMTGDMNTEYAMPGPGNVMPSAAPAAAATPAAPAAPASPPKPESTHMSKDQESLEKVRYEKRLADLEAIAATAQKEALQSHMRQRLGQLYHEGFQVDIAGELKLCEDRRYGRAEFDSHEADIRRLQKGFTAPLGDLPPLGVDRSYIHPTETQGDGQSEKYAKHHKEIQVLIRQGISQADAYERVVGEKYER